MDTMERLIVKYRRFIDIMVANPTHMAVPTLDVDLAWHTHQLSPQSYYGSTTTKASKFIDHDDKVSEDKLNTAFEWTSKTYQERYNDVYSECTCWYCESIRAFHISSVGKWGKLLGVSTNEKSRQLIQARRPCSVAERLTAYLLQSRKTFTPLAEPESAPLANQLTSLRTTRYGSLTTNRCSPR